MSVNHQLRVILLIVGLFTFASPLFAQSYEISDFLEFGYHDAKTIGSRDGVILVYSDGRYISIEDVFEKTLSGGIRRIRVRQEKQLEPEEIGSLVTMCQELFKSGPEYNVRKGQSDPPHFSISCRYQGRETSVTIINFNAGSDAEKSIVPSSVLKLMRWARPAAYP